MFFVKSLETIETILLRKQKSQNSQCHNFILKLQAKMKRYKKDPHLLFYFIGNEPHLLFYSQNFLIF